MYISLFIIVCAFVYITYLRQKNNELKELQKTIALLQEQLLLFEGIEKRVCTLKKSGILIEGLDNEDYGKQQEKVENFINILSHAYFKGWYQLSKQLQGKIHSNREAVEHKIPW